MQRPNAMLNVSWIFRALTREPTDESTTREMIDFIDGINSLIENDEINTLDVILSILPIDKLTTQLVLSAVRATYPIRDHLANWVKLRNRAANLFKERGRDPGVLLKGII